MYWYWLAQVRPLEFNYLMGRQGCHSGKGDYLNLNCQKKTNTNIAMHMA